MLQVCHSRLCLGTETVSCRLLQRWKRIETWENWVDVFEFYCFACQIQAIWCENIEKTQSFYVKKQSTVATTASEWETQQTYTELNVEQPGQSQLRPKGFSSRE